MLGAHDMSEKQPLLPSHAALPPSSGADQTVEALRRILVGHTIADVERHLILDTLTYCLGNRTHAARILGISIRTLRNKLGDYEREGFDVAEPGRTRTGKAA